MCRHLSHQLPPFLSFQLWIYPRIRCLCLHSALRHAWNQLIFLHFIIIYADMSGGQCGVQVRLNQPKLHSTTIPVGGIPRQGTRHGKHQCPSILLASCVYSYLGFEILAFPCNQFGYQEPGTNAEIIVSNVMLIRHICCLR